MKVSKINLRFIFTLLLLTAIIALLTPAPVQATSQSGSGLAVVNAVLFYSPSCSHCHKVITEDLPPLFEQYGEQLNIIGIDVTNPEGQKLYTNAVQKFSIPEDRLGVPCLIVGTTVLVGSLEIPEQLPGIIEAGLVGGGIAMPEIPGVQELLAAAEQETSAGDESPAVPAEKPASEQDAARPTTPETVTSSQPASLSEIFSRDLAGNSLAVIVLFGMVVSVFAVGYRFTRPARRPRAKIICIIPILSLLGLGVAAYLTYAEITQTLAVCGPVGDCNAVQQSPYAMLFGAIPIGLTGITGYLLILAVWLVQTYGPEKLKHISAQLVWGMALAGVLFSIYLTILEPFVIGATCMWCITSAVLMTLIFWYSTGAARAARGLR